MNSINGRNPFSLLIIISFSALCLNVYSASNTEAVKNLSKADIKNTTAYIPSQCYTKTKGEQGRVFNPCYTCHTTNQKPNFLDDSDLQLSYALPGPAVNNPWENLFIDRENKVAAISDREILNYVRENNYLSPEGEIILTEKLSKNLPDYWDFSSDGKWRGYIPDAYFIFDRDGLDRTPQGGYTGWRAFAYYPFPGTFWPTNGSTDDVLIRLDPAFWTDDNGKPSLEVYNINLAIIHALVTRSNVAINAVDETRYGVDLNKDDKLSKTSSVVFDWAPLEDKWMSYVGEARKKLEKGQLHLAAGLFPEGTEFLHSVRYLDINEDDTVTLSPRMKELRYAKKVSWYNYSELKGIAEREGFERAVNADATKRVPGNYEEGMFTQGWLYQGFIEDKDGSLRPQSQEETLYCMGCHGGIGVTTDTVFSYPRKFTHDNYQGGWYHWTQKGLVGVNEPREKDGHFEYTRYLETNKSGSEFRTNNEVNNRFFTEDGQLNSAEVNTLHDDISILLLPSRKRALMLNKAYRNIVKQQSFVFGRDATVSPQLNVHQQVIQGETTGIEEPQ